MANSSSIIVLFVLFCAIIALTKDRMRPGMILFSAAIVFLCAGILTPSDLLEGFSNKGMMTVALLFLISEGVRRSGILEKITRFVLPSSKVSIQRVQLRLLPVVASISAFLNNTPVVVIFAPIVKRWADQVKLPATKFLIPLSYATILGGMCTLVGTSTNLVVDGMIIDGGYPGFTMFELGKVGVFIAIVGIIYLILFSHWLLPNERKEEQHSKSFDEHQYQRIEVVLSARFPAIGRKILDFDFKRKYGATIVEIHRADEVILMHDMRKERYKEGDTLVLLGDDQFVENWGESSFFLLVSNGHVKPSPLPKCKRITAVVLLVLMIIGATVGELPSIRQSFPKVHLDMFFFSAVVAVIMAWMNIFPARKYTKYISWDILITIASALAVSKAMMNSGMADSVGAFVFSLAELCKGTMAPYIVLAILFILTDCFTELITNNAAAALMYPISVSIATHLNVNPMPFFVTICMAASTSFSTPIGYQTNLIVQSIGGYRFSDFVRVGLPLNIIAFVITLSVVPIFWPFN